MKRHIFIITIIVSLLTGTGFALETGPSWNAALYAVGEELGGVKYQEVTIGAETKAKVLPSPPLPVKYSVSLELADGEWNRLAADIRPISETVNMWVVAFNPHGNIMPPVQRKAVLSWFPFQLGPGLFQLIEGHDGSGEVLIPDMKAAGYIELSGNGETQYYTVVQIQ